jgi:hypothetical protein
MARQGKRQGRLTCSGDQMGKIAYNRRVKRLRIGDQHQSEFRLQSSFLGIVLGRQGIEPLGGYPQMDVRWPETVIGWRAALNL